MTSQLDLADIQGNIVRAYGKSNMPKARYFALRIHDAAQGRAFVERVRHRVTTAERWNAAAGQKAPGATLNIGFSWWGLRALGLPTRTLAKLPPEFIDGMAKRKDILGDIDANDPKHWDPVWRAAAEDPTAAVHAWISINAGMNADGTPVAELEDQSKWLRQQVDASAGGVELLSGHRPNEADCQNASAILGELPDGTMYARRNEHFGMADGFGDPVFEGQVAPQLEAQRVIGQGKLAPGEDKTWKPLATGEFLLGHPDESQEIPPSSVPWEFMRNGTFMAYRKLHENVAEFNDYIEDRAKLFARVMDVGEEEARATLKAKMVGRWQDGVPLMVAPTYDDWQTFKNDWSFIGLVQLKAPGDRTSEEKQKLAEYRRLMVDFIFRGDIAGVKCPVSAHMRRANTRDMLDPHITSKEIAELGGSALNNRRRIIRRGLPYGSAGDPDHEHGIIFMAVCASLFRQYEFVQQQWMNYGLDFNVGNDTCPMIGLHHETSKFVIASDPAHGKPPFICDKLPQFVTMRGGEYFFLPSLTALRQIAMGVVDPT